MLGASILKKMSFSFIKVLLHRHSICQLTLINDLFNSIHQAKYVLHLLDGAQKRHKDKDSHGEIGNGVHELLRRFRDVKEINTLQSKDKNTSNYVGQPIDIEPMAICAEFY